jgi:hypothetical protein
LQQSSHRLKELEMTCNLVGKNRQRLFYRLLAVGILSLPIAQATAQAASWMPPLGIPAPSFGIAETAYATSTHCPQWPLAANSKSGGQSYDCYYVDNSSIAASDTSNTFGSPTKPRKTIPEGTMSAGAYVEVHGGRTTPYTQSGDRFNWEGDGTATDYILILGIADATGRKPVLGAKVHLGQNAAASYLIFDGFEIKPISGGVEIRPATNGWTHHHIAVRNCFHNGPGTFKSGNSFSAGAVKSLTPNSYVNNVVFYNNVSVKAGQYDSLSEDDSSSFYVSDNTSSVWVVDNEGYLSGGDGAAGGHTAERSSDHYYIGRNTFYQHRENGIDIKEINDLIVSQNTLYSFRPTNSSAGEAVVIHYGSHSIGPNRAWVLFNKIYDAEVGVVINSTPEAHVIGNQIYDIHHTDATWNPTSAYSTGAGIRIYSGTTASIVDNTFYDYDTAVQIPSSSSFSSISIAGNVFSTRAESTGYDVLVFPTPLTSLNYNQFYNPAGSAAIGWGTATQMNVASIKSIAQCSACSEGNPLLENPPVDLRIGSASPCIDKSMQSPVYAAFSSLYGLTIAYDFGGAPRPAGAGWDIGATEYGATSALRAPTSVVVK